MKYLKYTTIKVKDIRPNACHNPMCEYNQRKRCEKERKCLIQLSGNEERAIGKVNIFTLINDKIIMKIDKAVNKWRKKQFLKCQPISIEITKGKK